jgi:hypothetical protein
MSNMNNNDRGRVTGLPGTTTTVTLHPQRLGVRMRNSIIRMLETRIIVGGWSSKSRQIAEAISEKHGLQCGISNWNGIRVLGLSRAAAPLLAETLHADWTAWLLENSEYRSGYYRKQYDQSMALVNEVNQNFYMTMHDKNSIRKVVEILTEHTPQELKQKAKEVADLFRGTEPIEITTFRS